MCDTEWHRQSSVSTSPGVHPCGKGDHRRRRSGPPRIAPGLQRCVRRCRAASHPRRNGEYLSLTMVGAGRGRVHPLPAQQNRDPRDVGNKLRRHGRTHPHRVLVGGRRSHGQRRPVVVQDGLRGWAGRRGLPVCGDGRRRGGPRADTTRGPGASSRRPHQVGARPDGWRRSRPRHVTPACEGPRGLNHVLLGPIVVEVGFPRRRGTHRDTEGSGCSRRRVRRR